MGMLITKLPNFLPSSLQLGTFRTPRGTAMTRLSKTFPSRKNPRPIPPKPPPILPLLLRSPTTRERETRPQRSLHHHPPPPPLLNLRSNQRPSSRSRELLSGQSISSSPRDCPRLMLGSPPTFLTGMALSLTLISLKISG